MTKLGDPRTERETARAASIAAAPSAGEEIDFQNPMYITFLVTDLFISEINEEAEKMERVREQPRRHETR